MCNKKKGRKKMSVSKAILMPIEDKKLSKKLLHDMKNAKINPDLDKRCERIWLNILESKIFDKK